MIADDNKIEILINIGASFLIYYGLESGGVLVPFIISALLTLFNGAVLDMWEEVK